MKKMYSYLVQITFILIGSIILLNAESYASPTSSSVGLSSSANPSDYGQSITITATVTGTGGTGGGGSGGNSTGGGGSGGNSTGGGGGIIIDIPPTGTVTFYDGAVQLGTGTLNMTHQASFTTSSLSPGTHTLTAVYQGDSHYSGSTSSQLSQVVGQISTNVHLSSTANPTSYGQSVIFTATVAAVSPGSGTPTGTVSFYDGSTQLGTSTLSGNIATFSTSSLSTGAHQITATYQGDSSYSGSTSGMFTQNVDMSDTNVQLSSSVNPSVYGQSVTFTATVAAVSPGSGTPAGTVTFTIDGSRPGGTVALDSAGMATFTTSSLSASTHSITATYSGDSDYSGSTSTVLTQTISQSSTSVSLFSSANPSVYGQSVMLTATVTAVSPGSGTPIGVVTFYNGGSVIGSSTLSDTGVATFSISSLSVDTHQITAVYAGNVNYGGSTSSQLPQVVGQSSTNVQLSSSANPSGYGQSITFTATVASVSPGSGIPTGEVVFYDGSTQLGTGTLSGGVATFSASSLSAGTHQITAVYSSDANYGGSTSSQFSQAIGQSPTNLHLSSSVNPSVHGQSITFTATVTGNSGTPTGTVIFYNGSIPLGTGTLNASGVATYTDSSLSAGTDQIVAVYQGDTDHSGSTSTMQQVIANLTSTPPGVHESISMDDLYAHTTQTPTPTPSPSSLPGATSTAITGPTSGQATTSAITSTPLPTQQSTTNGQPLGIVIVSIGFIAVAAGGYLLLRKH